MGRPIEREAQAPPGDARPEARPDAPPARLVIIILAVFLALCVGAALLPHDRYIRYQQLSQTLQFRLEWNYDRIHHDPTPIDLALIGVSRTQAAVSGPRVSQILSERLGRETHFVNLSFPQQGRNAHYAIARELLETRPEVKVLVLAVVEQMPRTPHPAFRNIADTRDLVTAPRLINYNYVGDLAFLPWRQSSLFVQTLFPAAFGMKTRFDPADYEGTHMDSTASFLSPPDNWVERDKLVPQAELARQTAQYLQGLVPARLPARFAEYEYASERVYLRRIGDLARRNGTEVIFLFMPIYGGPVVLDDPDLIAPYGPLLTASFIVDDHRLFSDYGHVNRNGSRLVTRWFAEQLASLAQAGRIDLNRQPE